MSQLPGKVSTHILVVDGDPLVEPLFKRALCDRDDLIVVAFDCGFAALEHLRQHPAYMLLTELSLSDYHGLDLIEAARSIQPQLPVIIMSQTATVDVLADAIHVGVCDFLTKPLEEQTLRQSLLRHSEGRSWISRQYRRQQRLRHLCRELNQSRRVMRQHIDTVCSDLVGAYKNLTSRYSRLRAAHDIHSELKGQLELDQVLRCCLNYLSSRIGLATGLIMVGDDRQPKGLHMAAFSGTSEESASVLADLISTNLGPRVVMEGESMLVPDVLRSNMITSGDREELGGGSLLIVPFPVASEVNGIIVFHRVKPPEFAANDQELLELIGAQASLAIQNAWIFTKHQAGTVEVISALAQSLDARHPYTHGHSQRVGRFCALVAERMDLSQQQRYALQEGAQLHDIGKIGVADHILDKPGPLDDDELAQVRSHCQIGDRILEPVKCLADIRPMVRHHHEWVNGAGYPDGLLGFQLDIKTRILAVADALDAMTTARPYRSPCSFSTALAELQRMRHKQFDADVVDAFQALGSDLLHDVANEIRAA